MMMDRLSLGSRLRRIEERLDQMEAVLLLLAENQHDMLNREMGVRSPKSAIQNIGNLTSVFEVIPMSHGDGE